MFNFLFSVIYVCLIILIFFTNLLRLINIFFKQIILKNLISSLKLSVLLSVSLCLYAFVPLCLCAFVPLPARHTGSNELSETRDKINILLRFSSCIITHQNCIRFCLIKIHHNNFYNNHNRHG